MEMLFEGIEVNREFKNNMVRKKRELKNRIQGGNLHLMAK